MELLLRHCTMPTFRLSSGWRRRELNIAPGHAIPFMYDHRMRYPAPYPLIYGGKRASARQGGLEFLFNIK